MTVIESILVSLFSIALVFIVLSFLFFTVKLLSAVLCKVRLNSTINADVKSEISAASNAAGDKKINDILPGALNLINVDEETAALIIAIISHESQIPLSELIFKSIKSI